MTKDTAKIVIGMMLSADGRCYYCAARLLERFLDRFPKFKRLAMEMYQEGFQEELELGG